MSPIQTVLCSIQYTVNSEQTFRGVYETFERMKLKTEYEEEIKQPEQNL